MNKAMFINGNDDDYTSPILSATDLIGPTDRLLFPFMNFTCNGSLTRLMFVANRYRESNRNLVTSWPVFSLWRIDEDYGNFQQSTSIGPDQITLLEPPSRSLIDDSEVDVVVINFTSPIRFVAGDILGLRQHNRPQNISSTGTFWPVVSDNSIKVLRQSGGYGLTLTCGDLYTSCPTDINGVQEMPYIAIETSKSLKACKWILMTLYGIE